MRRTTIIGLTLAAIVAVPLWYSHAAGNPGGSFPATLSSRMGDLQQVSDSALPVTIDGSLTPEKISDALAYYHFLLAVAPRPLESQDDVERRRALLRTVDLTTDDMTAVELSLQTLAADLEAISQSQQRSAETNSSADVEFFRDQRTERVDIARATLRDSLSPEGMERLDNFVTDHVKRHIMVYGN